MSGIELRILHRPKRFVKTLWLRNYLEVSIVVESEVSCDKDNHSTQCEM